MVHPTYTDTSNACRRTTDTGCFIALVCALCGACSTARLAKADGAASAPSPDLRKGPCARNATETCAQCAGGQVGTRRCAMDGSSYSACECPAYGAQIYVRAGARG